MSKIRLAPVDDVQPRVSCFTNLPEGREEQCVEFMIDGTIINIRGFESGQAQESRKRETISFLFSSSKGRSIRTMQIRLMIVYLALAVFLVALYANRAEIPGLLFSSSPINTRQTYVKLTTQATQLKLGKESNVPTREVMLNEPIALNFKTRAEVMRIRKEYVEQYRVFIKGEYVPFEPVYSQIADDRPWWGIRGEFCWGPGKGSIDGPAEETRFLINPYLLLGLDENKAFILGNRPCVPVYPHPVALFWYAHESKAVVTYDISRFFRERKGMPQVLGDYRILSLVDYNARDFGYEFVSVSPEKSKGVGPVGEGRLFRQACALRAFIHRGGSCGYPGGCNNQSPDEPDVRFKILELPAVLYGKLWKVSPRQVGDDADFTFIINLN